MYTYPDEKRRISRYLPRPSRPASCITTNPGGGKSRGRLVSKLAVHGKLLLFFINRDGATVKLHTRKVVSTIKLREIIRVNGKRESGAWKNADRLRITYAVIKA